MKLHPGFKLLIGLGVVVYSDWRYTQDHPDPTWGDCFFIIPVFYGIIAFFVTAWIKDWIF